MVERPGGCESGLHQVCQFQLKMLNRKPRNPNSASGSRRSRRYPSRHQPLASAQGVGAHPVPHPPLSAVMMQSMPVALAVSPGRAELGGERPGDTRYLLALGYPAEQPVPPLWLLED